MGSCHVSSVCCTCSCLPLSNTGKSYVVTNQKSLAQSMESLTQKLQPGVVIHFKKIGGVPSPPRNGEHENMDIDGEHYIGCYALVEVPVIVCIGCLSIVCLVQVV